ncbi:hypothetical protein SAMN05216350_101370 [Polaromonas sp. YR568]|nr:hypothetical protein SAMN05216350_101370 [Polaromonas sp. YR568]
MRFLLSPAGRGRPACDSLFFASPKKSKQKKGDPAVCVPPLRCGQPAVLGSGGVSLELASLRQSRSLIRLNLRSSAQPEGVGNRNTNTEYQTAEERNLNTRRNKDSPRRVLVGICLWYLVPAPIAPSVCAEERRSRRIRAKTCLSRRRVVFDPGWTEHRRLPAAKRRDADSRVAFSLLTFFWRSKRK